MTETSMAVSSRAAADRAAGLIAKAKQLSGTDDAGARQAVDEAVHTLGACPADQHHGWVSHLFARAGDFQRQSGWPAADLRTARGHLAFLADVVQWSRERLATDPGATGQRQLARALHTMSWRLTGYGWRIGSVELYRTRAVTLAREARQLFAGLSGPVDGPDYEPDHDQAMCAQWLCSWLVRMPPVGDEAVEAGQEAVAIHRRGAELGTWPGGRMLPLTLTILGSALLARGRPADQAAGIAALREGVDRGRLWMLDERTAVVTGRWAGLAVDLLDGLRTLGWQSEFDQTAAALLDTCAESADLPGMAAATERLTKLVDRHRPDRRR